MGILLCCFRDARDEEDESSDKIEGIRVPTDEGHNLLGGRKTKPDDKQGCKNKSQVRPEVFSDSKGSISHKYKLINDSESSRDDECPICLEGYDSENPRIITKCSHHYHLDCIYSWQERSRLCPTCLGVAEFEELK